MIKKHSLIFSRLVMGSFFLATVALFSCNNDSSSGGDKPAKDSAKTEAPKDSAAKVTTDSSKVKMGTDSSKPKEGGDTMKMDKAHKKPSVTGN